MASRDSTRLTASEGRRFAFTVGTAFLILAGVLAWRGHSRVGLVAGTIGVALVLAGITVPRLLGPVQRAWMGLAHAISRVTTPLFLTLIYYGVILPIGFLRRAFGSNPLVRRAGETYWIPRAPSSRRSDLKRQF